MNKFVIILLTVVMAFPAIAGELCFSPVKEREGDKSTKRSFFQSFDYKIQVDDGPVIKPSSENSTPYIVDTDSPLVKIWLGGKVVETFRVQNVWLDEGRNCIFFKNLYETCGQ